MGKLDTQSTVTLILNGQQTKTSLKEVTGAVNETRAALNKMRQDDNPKLYEERRQALGKLVETQKQMRDELNNAGQAQKTFFSEFKKGFGEVQKISAGVTIGSLLSEGIQSAAGALKSFVGSVIETYSTFQKFDAVLTNTLGDSQQSAEALKNLSKFAAETPFSMQELTDSYVKLVNRGIKPSNEEMRKMGDLAASQGKSFDQLTEAILDAVTGEFERLKEFGIRASKNGDMVKLSFKGITQEVANTDQAIQGAILKFGAMDGVAGGMQKMSERIGGVISNIGDNWDRFLNKVGSSTGGLIFSVAKTFNSLLEVLGETRSEAEQLTDQFNAQKESVGKLERNTIPLIDRYEQLKEKGNLNKTEQGELKKVINQIAETIPSAVTQWDKYGNAIDLNTKKARDFVAVQKALLEFQNKDAIAALVKERDLLTLQRNNVMKELQRGTTFDSFTGGTGGGGTSERKMTDKEILSARQLLVDATMKTKKIDDTIKGLTGSYLDESGKKAEAATNIIKKVSEMTVGELQKRLKQLNESLLDTTVGSDSYKKIIQDIKDTEKVLSQTKDDKKVVDGEKVAGQLASKMEQLRSEYLQLTAAAQKGTIDELDGQLKLIDDKYDKVVEKLLKLAKDPRFGKEVTGYIDNINKKGGLRDAAKAGVAGEFEKKREAADQKDQDAELKAAESRINGIYDQGASDLNNQQNSELNDTASANPEIQAALRYHIQELYAQKSYELEQQHLKDLKAINQAYGKDASALDKKIAENTIKENDRAAKEKIRQDQQYKEAKKNLQNMEMDTATQGTKLLQDVLGKNTIAYKAAFLTEQAIAAARVVMNTEAAIAGYAVSVAALGPLGIPLLAAYTITARISEGLSLAAILKQSIDGVKGDSKKAKNGALIPNGPSHNEGGIDLINNNTGERIAEMEGGEPIMILSKETYGNNRTLINELLYNSQRRNGAPVRVNSDMAIKATNSYLATGGMISAAGTGANHLGGSAGQNSSTDMAETNELLKFLADKFDDFAAKPWEFNQRAQEEYLRKRDNIRSRANPK